MFEGDDVVATIVDKYSNHNDNNNNGCVAGGIVFQQIDRKEIY